jgi:hypothetical protein
MPRISLTNESSFAVERQVEAQAEAVHSERRKPLAISRLRNLSTPLHRGAPHALSRCKPFRMILLHNARVQSP